MAGDISERRRLELLMRRAEAEEHLLERRLDRLADEQARARRSIQTLLGEQPWRRFV